MIDFGRMYDVLIAGGGNAALCAAIGARRYLLVQRQVDMSIPQQRRDIGVNRLVGLDFIRVRSAEYQ